ncbi:hypothetical protein PL263_19750 [Methylomonas sp. EFPC3]|uniref:hypothetical protein n=1 Tax=Methylomonas sp. EFPC3 TaxID=3021710 RepID=UPI002415AF9E|nr:hypothetical protein [Methylomonas sp. EFPC3]WFP50313.1 hypothetical protein PL263_19750 [Methylomonas sp. EFPC3]
MKIEDSYLRSLEIIHIHFEYSLRQNQQAAKLVWRLYQSDPNLLLDVYANIFRQFRADSPKLLTDDTQAKILSLLDRPLSSSESESAILEKVYSSINYEYALARHLLARMPKLDFLGLLELHESRRLSHPVLGEYKLLVSIGTALFALWNKSEIELLGDVQIRLPYDHIPGEWQNAFWIIIFGFSLLAGIYFFVIYSHKQRIHKSVKNIFEAGRIISESEKRLKQKTIYKRLPCFSHSGSLRRR